MKTNKHCGDCRHRHKYIAGVCCCVCHEIKNMENETNSGPTRKMTQDEILHYFRIDVDKNIQYVEMMIKDTDFNAGVGRELALVRTKLQEAKMWCGKALEIAGHPLPPEYADKATV